MCTEIATYSICVHVAAACNVQSDKNMMETMRELYNFFDNSPKRQAELETHIMRGAITTGARNLMDTS